MDEKPLPKKGEKGRLLKRLTHMRGRPPTLAVCQCAVSRTEKSALKCELRGDYRPDRKRVVGRAGKTSEELLRL